MKKIIILAAFAIVTTGIVSTSVSKDGAATSPKVEKIVSSDKTDVGQAD